MAAPKVFFVHLRRPGRNDERTDPMYEFGSFGCTKCHSNNLLHPDNFEKLAGARLAFIQGGHLGSRLVLLTPPIRVKVWKKNCEARWKPADMPFKYAEAPVLACNDGSSDFPLIKQLARKTHRPTVEGGLSSLFRSRSRPLSEEMAKQVVSIYNRLRKVKPHSAIASKYYDAMPLPYVRKVDPNRKETYRDEIRKLRAETRDEESGLGGQVKPRKTQARPRCGPSRRRQLERRTNRCI